MCGIGGIINLNADKVNEAELEIIGNTLRERGPDNTGFWIDENIGFVHTRLSIIDLSESGNQPMIYNNSVITFNGEIYNYKILQKELQDKGISFSSNTDTEVILKGYHVWGIDLLLKKIDGMFAFSLYDQNKNLLFLCRDRIGKKPLYVFKNNKRIIFSSEIKPISKIESNLTVDYNSVDYFLTELSIPQPKTIWNEVCQVEPGTYQSYNFTNNSFYSKKYYSFSINRNFDFSETSILEELEKKIKNAVLKRTMADVQIGCFLSGGVDSGIIVSTLAQYSSKRVKTYTIGFKEKKYSELDDAKIVVEKYNTDHTEFIIEPRDMPNVLINLLDYVGEPFADPSLIPTYFICREISKHVKVALSGDGGDEVFGGYGVFLTSYLAEKFVKENPNIISRNLKVLLNKIAAKSGISKSHYGLYNSFLGQNGSERLYKFTGFNYAEKHLLYNKSYVKNSSFTRQFLNNIWAKNDQSNSITDALFLSSMGTRLLNGYLVKVDRMSMKNSIEVRSPLLDTELMEFSFGINQNALFGNGKSAKFLLKKIVEKRYDAEIFKREKKGFHFPIEEWIKSDMKELVNDTLLSDTFKNRGLFNENYVRKIIQSHMENKHNYSYKIWALLCLELWFKKNQK